MDGFDICGLRDEDDLDNQRLLDLLLSWLSERCPKDLPRSLSRVFSYVCSLVHSGSADGGGMNTGWSRRMWIGFSPSAESFSMAAADGDSEDDDLP